MSIKEVINNFLTCSVRMLVQKKKKKKKKKKKQDLSQGQESSPDSALHIT